MPVDACFHRVDWRLFLGELLGALWGLWSGILWISAGDQRTVNSSLLLIGSIIGYLKRVGLNDVR